MTKDLRKRPFVRPLFLWILGICISVYIPFDITFITLSTGAVLFVLGIYFFVPSVDHQYNNRWIWGGCFSILFLALSCAYVYYRLRLDGLEDIPEWQGYFKVLQLNLVKTFDSLDLQKWEREILSTITFGFRENLDSTVRHRFSLAGAAHILAVSGFHVGVVYSFFRICLSIIPTRKTELIFFKNLCLLLLIWTFVSLTGLAASAVRAAFMLSLYIIGKTLRRKTDSYNTWCAAAFCMLVYNPFYLFDLGFELSFLAVLSILFFFPRINSVFKLKNPLIRIPWSWFSISIAAQIGTLPLCLYYWGEVSSVALLSALPVTILSILIIPLGLLWAVTMFMGFHMESLKIILELLMKCFCDFVNRMGQIEPLNTFVPFTAVMLLLVYLFLLFLCFFIMKKQIKYLLISINFFFLFSLAMLIERFC